MKNFLPNFLIQKIINTSNHLGLFGIILYFLTFLSKIYEKIIIYWSKNQLKQTPFEPEIKVISIGNITCGGTGKTPLVGWLGKYFDSNGLNAGIILRGYGRKININQPIMLGSDYTSENEIDYFGDEALLLRELCPHAKIIVSKDRIDAIQKLQNETDCDIIILDDGFQQLKLKKEWNIVCFDHKKPFGNEYLIPRGVLREPLKALNRATHFIFPKGTPRKRVLNKMTEQLKNISDSIFCCEYNIHGAYLMNDPLSFIELEKLKEENLLILSGIGNPDSFYSALMSLDIEGEHKVFPDHYNFKENDINDLQKYIFDQNITGIIITEKDSMRLKHVNFTVPCYVMETELLPAKELTQEVDQLIEKIQKSKT